jgi:hypothetical protein
MGSTSAGSIAGAERNIQERAFCWVLRSALNPTRFYSGKLSSWGNVCSGTGFSVYELVNEDLWPMTNTETQKTAFIQDNHKNRQRRSERVNKLKELGYKVIPGRGWDLSLERCLRHDFDLVVVHEGDSLAKAIETCDSILAKKPNQNVVLVTGGDVQKAYACGDDLRSIEKRVRECGAQQTNVPEVEQPRAA